MTHDPVDDFIRSAGAQLDHAQTNLLDCLATAVGVLENARRAVLKGEACTKFGYALEMVTQARENYEIDREVLLALLAVGEHS